MSFPMDGWMRSWNTTPAPGELVLVALYDETGKRRGDVLAECINGEWVDAEHDGAWPLFTLGLGRCAGLLWRYYESAPDLASEIPGYRSAA